MSIGQFAFMEEIYLSTTFMIQHKHPLMRIKAYIETCAKCGNDVAYSFFSGMYKKYRWKYDIKSSGNDAVISQMVFHVVIIDPLGKGRGKLAKELEKFSPFLKLKVWNA
ncbi:hypothetical protein HELRODRAFT_165632 [Helobdella robusta]|uniref:Uncharacterized protein n=1 Tax=Helobdella robusta TaxID=6412 RepID=T1EX37_HELRO|nr:hypothetical protein HELRODRAFT_165632 [Helobdella robusta]ESN91579.1 hypothetical protein HELRODRAFT_165632 [Helobdella robusta]